MNEEEMRRKKNRAVYVQLQKEKIKEEQERKIIRIRDKNYDLKTTLWEGAALEYRGKSGRGKTIARIIPAQIPKIDAYLIKAKEGTDLERKIIRENEDTFWKDGIKMEYESDVPLYANRYALKDSGSCR